MDNRRRPASIERRLHPRYVLNSLLRLPVRAISTRIEKPCRIIDYSDGGLLIEWLSGTDNPHPLKPGDRVHIKMEPEAPSQHWGLCVVASVVRTAYAIVALEFERADPRALERLRSHVMLHLDSES